jgi:probable F420-dependent oxidoreductase
MEIGVTMFVTDRAMPPVELARAVEERGLGSLFLPEHTHIPVSRRTPYPGGGELPDEYRRTYDPFVALAAASAITSRLVVGTGVCLVAQHDPITLAKEVASLDHVSGGRFVFGIGFGWNVDEMEDHGVEAKTRRDVVREKVLAMKSLWTQEEGSFDGTYVRISPSWSWPKPVQDPHPPIFIGGAAGPALFRHVVDYADGWMPIGGAGMRGVLPELHRVAEEAGRDPDTVKLMVFGARGDAAQMDYYRSLGVTRTVLGLPSAPTETILPILDRYAGLLTP